MLTCAFQNFPTTGSFKDIVSKVNATDVKFWPDFSPNGLEQIGFSGRSVSQDNEYSSGRLSRRLVNSE